MNGSTLRIGVLMPEVLGTYRDTDNMIVLKEQVRRHGIVTKIVKAGPFDMIPGSLDIYALGSGEDTAQSLVAQKLREDPSLMRALNAGRPPLTAYASLQVLGHWYRDTRDRRVAGLGVLDITTDPQSSHSIGELVSGPILESLTEILTGSGNHGGGTVLGSEVKPLGRIVEGTGNGTPEDCEPAPVAYNGVVQGSIITTYMHGPYLARNPKLTDLLVSRTTGLELEPLEVPGIDALRAERLGTLGV